MHVPCLIILCRSWVMRLFWGWFLLRRLSLTCQLANWRTWVVFQNRLVWKIGGKWRTRRLFIAHMDPFKPTWLLKRHCFEMVVQNLICTYRVHVLFVSSVYKYFGDWNFMVRVRILQPKSCRFVNLLISTWVCLPIVGSSITSNILTILYNSTHTWDLNS